MQILILLLYSFINHKNTNMDNKKSDIESNESISTNEYVIRPEGSLGLLALGAVGLEAWRKVKKEANKQKKENSKNQGN